VLEATIVKTRKQHVGVVVTQSLDVDITTTRVETVVAPTMDVVRKGILIGSTTKLGNGLGGVSARRKLSGSMALSTTTTRVVGTSQMIFTNLMMTIHVNTTIDRPPMSSMVVGGYKSADAMNLTRGY
jgi:hypothetical protein